MNKRIRIFMYVIITAALILCVITLLLIRKTQVKNDGISHENTEKIEGIIVTDEDSSPIDKKYLIGFSQCNFSEPWRAEMNHQMKSAILQHPEFELIILDGRQDNNKQISDIQRLVQLNCDLIFVSPNEGKPLKDSIENVYDSGIPIILIDRKIDGESYTQYIGADNYEIGFKAGLWAVKALGDKGGNIIEISGSIGTSAQIARHNGFIDAIKEYPNIKIIDSDSSDWLMEKSISIMENMLEKHSSIDLVYAHNDPSAEGAYIAAKQVGIESDIMYIGVDALSNNSGGIKSVIDGRISVTYLYPTGAKEAVESAYKLLIEKEELVKDIRLRTVEITKNNAETILNSTNLDD